MFGRVNGVAKQLQDEIGTMISVHCLAHRLALAATDSVEALMTLRNTALSHSFVEVFSLVLFCACPN